MAIYLGNSNFFEHLKNEYEAQYEENPNITVDIATSALYLGISKGTDWSVYYDKSADRLFYDKVLSNGTPLRLLVSIPYKFICKEGCKHCISLYNQKLDRIKDTIKLLHIENVKFSSESLLNYYRIGNQSYLGSTSSNSNQLITGCTSVPNPDMLSQFYEFLWNNSTTNLGGYYEKEISEDN